MSAPPPFPIVTECEGDRLLGMIHPAEGAGDLGVLIVVGGPQYRAGAHRQFVHLARSLAEGGIPAMRFDQRGIGDSEGRFPGFLDLDPDIAAAIGAFQAQLPNLRRIVLWGLCDAASAILLYAHRDPRVAGAVLANPWVRTEQVAASAHLRFHYPRQLVSPAFWGRLLRGEVQVGRSLRGLWSDLRQSRGGKPARQDTPSPEPSTPEAADPDFPRRMAQGLAALRAPVLILLSGNDPTADEFRTLCSAYRRWKKALGSKSITQVPIPGAAHTFPSEAQRTAAAAETLRWLEAELRHE